MSSSLVVYKASAGSGKTFTLAVQYIKLLITKKPQEYQNTLAVTFTNKATAEMKERILEQLYGISLGLKSSDGYVEALQKELKKDGMELTVEQIRTRCHTALHEILHDYSRFRVETIDSFFQSVLRNLAHELGLNAKMEVDLNDKEVLNLAVDNILDGLKPEEKSVLPWITMYIEERIKDGDKWDVRDDIKNFAKCIFLEDYMRRDEEIRKRLTDSKNIENFKKSLRKMDRELMDDFEEKLSEAEKKIEATGLDFSKYVKNASYYSSFLKRLHNYDDTISSSTTGDDFFWTKSLEENTSDAAKFLKKDCSKDASLAALAEEIMPLFRKLNELAHQVLKPHVTVKLALKHLNPLRMLNIIDEEVNRITSDANRFILAKTPILLSELIKDTDAPFVFEKMGTLFNNVMIDEFQDTSRLQWQNFKVLMLENQAQGGSDLLVGDIKQSIYRWRNGDWGILANINHEMASHKPDIRNLDTNFRSEYHIINFNNHFFPIAAKTLDKKSDEFDIAKGIYGDVKQKCKKKEQRGWVRAVVYTGGKKNEWEELMLEDLCTQVEELHQGGIPYSEMCILQRTRNHVDRIIEYFNLHLPHVSLVSDEAFKLDSSHVLTIMVNALKVMSSWKVPQYDKEGKPRVDEEGKTIVEFADNVSLRLLMKYYLTDIMDENGEANNYALVDPDKILPELFGKRDELVTLPLQEICEEIYRTLHLSKITGEDSYLLYFYDELSAYLQNAPGDIESFLQFWENDMSQKAIPACKVNGISIITIHKSKGLQYHTVLMPYCNFEFEKFKADELLWCEPEDDPFSDMAVLPIHPGKQMSNSYFSKKMNTETAQKDIEELNALYVAFTRAERNLLVWATEDKATTAGSIIASTLKTMTNPVEGTDEYRDEEKRKDSLYEIEDEPECNLSVEEEDGCTIYSTGAPLYEIKEYESSSNRLNPEMEKRTIAMCSYNRKQNFKQSTEGMLFIEEMDEETSQDLAKSEEGLSFIQLGSLMHEIFSRIDQKEQLDDVIQAYIDQGTLKRGKQSEQVRKLLDRALSNKKATHWFDGTYSIQNECEITYVDHKDHKAKVLRPDRVMMNDREIIIVDFKFGKPHPEEYRKQVRDYMKLLQEMYPEHALSGYLWYVYRNKIETINLEA